MRTYMVWELVNGLWEVIDNEVAFNRHAVLQKYNGLAVQRRNGCIKVRLIG